MGMKRTASRDAAMALVLLVIVLSSTFIAAFSGLASTPHSGFVPAISRGISFKIYGWYASTNELCLTMSSDAITATIVAWLIYRQKNKRA